MHMVDRDSIRHAEAGMTDVGNWLQELVVLANAEAFALNGDRDTCISTSYALCHVLQQLGFNARPLRIEVGVFPNHKLGCVVLGRPSRIATEPGMWCGHLAVAIGRDWLLDATLDQANKDEWLAGAHVGPIVVRLTEEFWTADFWTGSACVFIQVGESRVRFCKFPRQNGFARTGAARPSNWRPLADRILLKLSRACGTSDR
jgi:hypothetical protein